MSNVFNSFAPSSSSKKDAKKHFSTRSATPATCIGITLTKRDNSRYAKSEDEMTKPVVRLTFKGKNENGDEVIEHTNWMDMYATDVMKNSKKWLALFDKKKDIIEFALDPVEMFNHKFSVQSVESQSNGKTYYNIGTIYDDGPMNETDKAEGAIYDLDGYPPFKTAKVYKKTFDILEMYVRLEGGDAHKVDDAEFKVWLDQPPTNND